MGNKQPNTKCKSKYDYEPIPSERIIYSNEKCAKCKIVNNKYQHVLTCPKCPTTLRCYDCEWNCGMVTTHNLDTDNCIYYETHNRLYYLCPCLRSCF